MIVFVRVNTETDDANFGTTSSGITTATASAATPTHKSTLPTGSTLSSASGAGVRSKKRQAVGSTETGVHLLQADDIDKMKQRAAENHMFLYVKIPEVALTVSYKVRVCYTCILEMSPVLHTYTVYFIRTS